MGFTVEMTGARQLFQRHSSAFVGIRKQFPLYDKYISKQKICTHFFFLGGGGHLGAKLFDWGGNAPLGPPVATCLMCEPFVAIYSNILSDVYL